MKDIKGLQYLGLLSQIGLNLSLPLVTGVYFGAYMDKRFSTGSVFLFLGTIIGVLSGVTGVYRIIAFEVKKKGQ